MRWTAQGYIYIRAEYPLAVRRIKNAIAQAKNMGLGDNILGSIFSFKLLVGGAGAFVCGEKLRLASIEVSGHAEARPPFPAKRPLGKPTNINNVETFSNVP